MAELREIAGSLNYRIDVTAQLERHDGRFLEDVTSNLQLQGCYIKRDNCNTVHATARLRFDRELSWSSRRLRLAIISTDLNTGDSVTTPAGVWLMETPARPAGQTPVVWQIDCYGLLTILDVAPSITVSIPDGTAITEACQTVADLAGAGVTLDLAGIEGTVRGNKTWPINDNDLTLLGIINELLESARGRDLWVDQEGVFKSRPWLPLNEVPIELDLDGVSDEAILGQKMDQAVDVWGVPNRWVVIADLPGESMGGIPVEGDGIVTINNVNEGPTSQQVRGRIIPEIVKVDAVNQEALEAEAQRIREDAERPAGLVKLCAVPALLFWHRDVVTVTAPDLGFDETKQVVRSWQLPLDGGQLSFVTAVV